MAHYDRQEGTRTQESQPEDTNPATIRTDHLMIDLEDLPNVLTVREAAQVLRLSRNTMYGVIKSGQVRATRVGRKILIAKSALLHFLEG